MAIASSNFILAYHGCDAKLAEDVFAGRTVLGASRNDYDWLGHGVYFWEHNARRAYEFGKEVSLRPHPSGQKVVNPAVVGAVVDLRNCLNLLDADSLTLVKRSYENLVAIAQAGDFILPANSGGPDRLRRKLDCFVIEALHESREEERAVPFDSVRAAFVEGTELYPNAGFAAKNHIQVCVRHPGCIKGYFRPLDEVGRPVVFGA